MDKYLKKLNQLERKLEDLNEQKKQSENKKNDLYQEKIDLNDRKNSLNLELGQLVGKINRVKEASKELKKTIVELIIDILIIILGTVTLTLAGIQLIALLVTTIGIMFGIGNIADYISEKKFLKENNCDELETKIKQISNEIDSIEINLNSKDIVIDKLNHEKEQLDSETRSLSLKISEIKDIRNSVIDAYIKNNPDLDRLLDESYNNFNVFASNCFEEGPKQYIKK